MSSEAGNAQIFDLSWFLVGRLTKGCWTCPRTGSGHTSEVQRGSLFVGRGWFRTLTGGDTKKGRLCASLSVTQYPPR